MTTSRSYESAKTRSAIYLAAGLVSAGLTYPVYPGLMISAAILLYLSYWEHGNARIVRAEDDETGKTCSQG
jgi:hypothetical protein